LFLCKKGNKTGTGFLNRELYTHNIPPTFIFFDPPTMIAGDLILQAASSSAGNKKRKRQVLFLSKQV